MLYSICVCTAILAYHAFYPPSLEFCTWQAKGNVDNNFDYSDTYMYSTFASRTETTVVVNLISHKQLCRNIFTQQQQGGF